MMSVSSKCNVHILQLMMVFISRDFKMIKFAHSFLQCFAAASCRLLSFAGGA